ncbi:MULTISPECIES: LysR family transcriptional regulator [Pontibacillus]|uniref:LysR family transcriptional regulator n=1 Tax=Pontibacillus chungwhensis TaxID=265426 RepID=A0ABY8UXQ0_9BACI|nr:MULTISPECIES: LysR family transcriptional regulator [Pontibacillus]MCD5325697.1 LysR family transcriptional regulator [Pontibacillus sp. HN14]WIF98063.1 LysR family transcriptional regulator [Pontibacillus chungwhensis]
MDIKHLQYFIAVSRFNSFTRAAEELYLTQPTISKMIKNLEEDLGVILFDRSRKKLTLTDAGKVILKQAKVIDAAYQDLEVEIDQLFELKKGEVRIGLPPIMDSTFFSTMISQFHDKYPHITFQFIEHGSKKIEEQVRNEEIDIGIVVLPTKDHTFEHLTFSKEKLKLIVPHSHPLAKHQEISLNDIRNEEFILFNKDFVLRERIVQSCRQAGFEPTVRSESSQWDFIEEMVACKLGVTLLPESIIKNQHRDLCSISIQEPSIPWELDIIWNPSHHLSHAAQEWINFTHTILKA